MACGVKEWKENYDPSSSSVRHRTQHKRERLVVEPDQLNCPSTTKQFPYYFAPKLETPNFLTSLSVVPTSNAMSVVQGLQFGCTETVVRIDAARRLYIVPDS